jgi:hypothetical protein
METTGVRSGILERSLSAFDASVEQETGRHVGPGFQFSFNGLRTLSVRAVKGRFSKDSQFEDVPWNPSNVEAGKTPARIITAP